MHSSSSSTTTMIWIVATLLCFVAPQNGSAWVPSAPFLPSHGRRFLLDKSRPSQPPLFVSSSAALTATTRNRPAGHAEVVPDSANDFRDNNNNNNNNVLNYYGVNDDTYNDDTYNDYSLEEEELLLAEEEEEEERLAEEEEALLEEEEILANAGELVPFETDDGQVFVAATRGDMIPFLEEEEERLMEEEEMDRMYYYNDEERDVSMMLYDDEPVSPLFDRFSSFVGETTNALVSGTIGLLSPWFTTTTTPFIETMDIMESNTIMANNNMDVQPLLEEAEDILNGDENCLNFLGDDIEIGPVFSQSTVETSMNGNVRQETVLQASVQGSLYEEEGEATVEIIAVNGGMIEEMLVQLEDGTEINLPGIAAMDEDYYEDDEMEEEILAEEEDILAEEEEEIEEEEMRRNQFR